LALSSAIAIAGCGGQDSASERADFEKALAAFLGETNGAEPRNVTCEEVESSWECEATMPGGGTVSCAVGGDSDHPEFSCLQ